jgi:hypothetical protein
MNGKLAMNWKCGLIKQSYSEEGKNLAFICKKVVLTYDIFLINQSSIILSLAHNGF